MEGPPSQLVATDHSGQKRGAERGYNVMHSTLSLIIVQTTVSKRGKRKRVRGKEREKLHNCPVVGRWEGGRKLGTLVSGNLHR